MNMRSNQRQQFATHRQATHRQVTRHGRMKQTVEDNMNMSGYARHRVFYIVDAVSG
jgi:hypothetical protein